MLPANAVQVQGQGIVSADALNSFTQWCPSVVALRNFIGIGGMTVDLQGTVTPGDGGQGLFYWNSTGTAPDDDGVTTVVPNGVIQGEWTRIPPVVITGVQNLTNAINFASAGNVASAATTPIGAAAGNYMNITGTTTITAFDTVQAGSWRVVRFTGILTLTYNSTSLILPSGANITTAAGDTAEFVSLGGGNWLCVNYTRFSGQALVSGAGQTNAVSVQVFTAGSGTYTATAGVQWIRIKMVGGGGGGAGSGTGAGSAAGNGGNTTFGTSLLTANGGGAGVWQAASNSGGNVTVNSPALAVVAFKGADGNGYSQVVSINQFANTGAFGAGTPFAGSTASGSDGTAGGSAIPNTGCGGQGGGLIATSAVIGGSGGSAGGYIEAIINAPSATYTYSIGAAGTAGTAGASGFAGGTGGSGYIVVEEHYVF